MAPAKPSKLAKKSLTDEKKAIRDYTTRASETKDSGLKRVFRHNRSEERQHARALKPYAGGR